MPDATLVAAIRSVLSGSPFHGEGHRRVWVRFRIAGVRTSKRRVLRLMREHGLLAPSRVGVPRGLRTHGGTIIRNFIRAARSHPTRNPESGGIERVGFDGIGQCP